MLHETGSCHCTSFVLSTLLHHFGNGFTVSTQLHLQLLSLLPPDSPKNSETHFKVIVVSDHFAKVKTPLQRHRLVNSILKAEIETGGPVHALSIVAKTPKQWEAMASDNNGVVIGPSPSCRGGDGSLPKRNEES